MQNTLSWRPQCLALRDKFRILTYDARAQGQSDVGLGELSLEGHAADLSELLKHLDIEKVHLVGLSHGAKVALALAANKPEQVDRLVLCSVGAMPTCRSELFVRSWIDMLRGSGLAAMVWASLPVVLGERFLKQKKRLLSSIVSATVKRNSKEALVAHLDAMAAYPALSRVAAHIRVPTLVISASEDPLVTQEGAQELAALCKGQHKRLLEIGHSVPSEAPELFNQTLLEFLDKA